jgi:hypothetical protein
LYSVPISGPFNASTKLNEPLPDVGEVFASFRFSTDSSQVFFRADQETPGVIELYVVDLPVAGNDQFVYLPFVVR